MFFDTVVNLDVIVLFVKLNIDLKNFFFSNFQLDMINSTLYKVCNLVCHTK